MRWLVVLLVFLAGCQPAVGGTARPVPSLTVSEAAGQLLAFHSPGKISYSTHPTGCHARGELPDPRCTPGSVDPAVTQATIGTTICRAGYTTTVRPPSSDTAKAKRMMYRAYGIPVSVESELDHLVPLVLGGSNDITNLWIEAGDIPNPKDAVEVRLKRDVCAGRMSLAEAQAEIAGNWRAAGPG